MYLNSIAILSIYRNQKVEPKHKMYLNVSIGILQNEPDAVEPKHKMYLN